MNLNLALKTAGFLFLAFLMFHWLTAGQDQIIEGPPETPDISSCQAECPIQ